MRTNVRFLMTGLLVGLLIGGVAGRFIPFWRFAHHGPGNGHEERMLRRLDKRLGLDEQQRTKITAILASTRQKMEALLAEGRPKFEALRKDTGNQIRSLLRPDQQTKFDALQAEMDEHRRKFGWHDHGPPGP